MSERMAALTRISDVVKHWAEHSPDSPALVESSGAWTYHQLASAISNTQTWLRALGVRPGDRVVIVGENCRSFIAILLASAALDVWPVLVNARLSNREIDEIQDHWGGARRVLYTISVSPHASDHAKRHGAVVEEREKASVQLELDRSTKRRCQKASTPTLPTGLQL